MTYGSPYSIPIVSRFTTQAGFDVEGGVAIRYGRCETDVGNVAMVYVRERAVGARIEWRATRYLTYFNFKTPITAIGERARRERDL